MTATYTAWIGIDKGIQDGISTAHLQPVASGMDKAEAWEKANASMLANPQAISCTIAPDGKQP